MLLSILYKIISIYIVICIFTFFFQRKLIYYPSRNVEKPKFYGLQNFKELYLKTSDGVKIHTWENYPLDKSKPVILFFHGNGGDLSYRTEIFKNLTKDDKYNLIAIDYRGYGNSEGKPSENGLYKDARALIKYVKDNNFNEEDIILYGESLGTGVAVQMATEYRNVKAIILQSPIISLTKRAQEIYWYLLPVKFLTIDKFDNLSKIKKIDTPILFMHGLSDLIVPDNHSRVLHKNSNSRMKKIVFFDDKGHNNLNMSEVANVTKNFLEKLGEKKSNDR